MDLTLKGEGEKRSELGISFTQREGEREKEK